MIYVLTTYADCDDCYYPSYEHVTFFPTEIEAIQAARRELADDDVKVKVEEISVVDGKIVRRQINIEEVA